VLTGTRGPCRFQPIESLPYILAGLVIVQLRQVVLHQQGRVGGHQIDECSTERIPHTLSGGQHPRHIVLVDLIEQAQHQAIDADHLDPRRHAGSASSA